ncbi:MAG TPA: deoxyribonuclease IV [Vicinamibacteria bacterium]|nr:deoxyribonuclease IV [Vicinamibacteria bacterium]
MKGPSEPLLGAHVPVKGGTHNAPANGQAIAAAAIQIFTRSQVQWKCKPMTEEESAAFRTALAAATGVRVVLAHGSYLVNLASPVPEILDKSREAFCGELLRCHALGIPYLVFHPGAHMGAGEAQGLRAVAASLDEALDATGAGGVMPLIEVTAGAGSWLGHRFEQLAEILSRLRRPERVGVCLDTCHLYAAGYDIARPKGYERTLADFDRIVGLGRLKAIHLNDAKQGLGSRLDRHARAGQGQLGLATFRRILNDPRLAGVPMVVETPGPLEEWKKELRLLRSLVARPRRRRTRRLRR